MKKLSICLIILLANFSFAQVPYIERLRVEAGKENKGIIPITFTSIDRASFTLTIYELAYKEGKQVVRLTKSFKEGESFIFNFNTAIDNNQIEVCVEYQCWKPKISNGELNIDEARFGYSPSLCRGDSNCVE